LGGSPRILVVDDESSVRRFMERVLSDVGYFVTSAPTARWALAEVRNRQLDVIVLDLSLPDADGLEVIRQIRSERLPPRILAISGFMVGDMPNTALSAGATATLVKPIAARTLLDAVYHLLDFSGGWRGN